MVDWLAFRLDFMWLIGNHSDHRHPTMHTFVPREVLSTNLVNFGPLVQSILAIGLILLRKCKKAVKWCVFRK